MKLSYLTSKSGYITNTILRVLNLVICVTTGENVHHL